MYTAGWQASCSLDGVDEGGPFAAEVCMFMGMCRACDAVPFSAAAVGSSAMDASDLAVSAIRAAAIGTEATRTLGLGASAMPASGLGASELGGSARPVNGLTATAWYATG